MSVGTARPRLIATDLDGTLLSPSGTVSARTGRAMALIRELGVDIIFVTARPPRWVHDLADLVGGHGIAICANGAFVYDVHRRTVLRAHTIPVETVHSIVADLRARLPGVGFAAELAHGVHIEAVYPELHPQSVPSDAVFAPMETLTAPVGKLLARTLQAPEDEFILQVTEIVGSRAEVTHSGSGGLAEIGPLGVTKATALVDWCEMRGVTADHVWAFGDMPNDIPMLRWAGTSYAVANAHPAVRAIADHVCAANGDDGVARVLEQLAQPG